MIQTTPTRRRISPTTSLHIGTNSNGECSGAIEESGEVNGVDVDERWVYFGLPLRGGVAGCATCAAGRVGVQSVPGYYLFRGDGGRGAVFVGVDYVGEEGTPAVVGVVDGVVEGGAAGGEEAEVVGVDGTDVVLWGVFG